MLSIDFTSLLINMNGLYDTFYFYKQKILQFDIGMFYYKNNNNARYKK